MMAGCFLFAENNLQLKKILTNDLFNVLLKYTFQKLLSS